MRGWKKLGLLHSTAAIDTSELATHAATGWGYFQHGDVYRVFSAGVIPETVRQSDL